jgi:hypothetical protein
MCSVATIRTGEWKAGNSKQVRGRERERERERERRARDM